MVGQWDGLFVLPLYHYIPILSYYNISSLLPLYYQYYQYTTMISLLYIYITSLSSVCCIYMTNITTNHMPSICQVYIYQSYTSYINVVTQLQTTCIDQSCHSSTIMVILPMVTTMTFLWSITIPIVLPITIYHICYHYPLVICCIAIENGHKNS